MSDFILRDKILSLSYNQSIFQSYPQKKDDSLLWELNEIKDGEVFFIWWRILYRIKWWWLCGIDEGESGPLFSGDTEDFHPEFHPFFL